MIHIGFAKQAGIRRLNRMTLSLARKVLQSGNKTLAYGGKKPIPTDLGKAVGRALGKQSKNIGRRFGPKAREAFMAGEDLPRTPRFAGINESNRRTGQRVMHKALEPVRGITRMLDNAVGTPGKKPEIVVAKGSIDPRKVVDGPPGQLAARFSKLGPRASQSQHETEGRRFAQFFNFASRQKPPAGKKWEWQG